VKRSVSLFVLALASAATVFLVAHGFSLEDCTDEDDLPQWFGYLAWGLGLVSGLALGASIFLAFRRRWYWLGSFVSVFGGLACWFAVVILGLVTAPSCPS
jgi:ABC-type Fe3+ transport system permease subunit